MSSLLFSFFFSLFIVCERVVYIQAKSVFVVPYLLLSRFVFFLHVCACPYLQPSDLKTDDLASRAECTERGWDKRHEAIVKLLDEVVRKKTSHPLSSFVSLRAPQLHAVVS